MKFKLLKTAGILFLLLNGLQLQAQLRHLGFPLGPRESQYYCDFGACNSGNDLWVVLQIYDSIKKNRNFKICKNNGLFWTELYKYTGAPGPNTELNACFYNGDLYFNVSFNNLVLNSVSYQPMNGIFKWDGSAVTFIDSVKGNIRDMDTFQNKLIITGNFTKVGNSNISRLAQYDGSTWSVVGNPADWVNFQPGLGQKSSSYTNGCNQIVSQGNRLYITGAYNIVNGAKPLYYGLGVYDGTSLSPVSSSEFTNSSFYYGEIYAHPDSTKYYANDSVHKTFYCETGQPRITVSKDWSSYFTLTESSSAFAYKGGSIYTLKARRSGSFYAAPAILEKLTGKNIQKIALPSNMTYDGYRNYGIFGKNAVFLVLNPNGLGSQAFYRLDSNENLTATITGKVFLDKDGDSVFSWNDVPVSNAWIVLKPSNASALTDRFGDYMLYADSGREQTELIKPGNRAFRFPSSGKYSDSLVPGNTYTRNFAMMYDSSLRDIGVELSAQLGWRVRRWFRETYTLKISNLSGYVRSGKVHLNFDSLFFSPQCSDTSMLFSGRTGTYTYNNLGPEQNITVKFTLQTYMSGILGNFGMLTASLDSTTLSWDNKPENNRDTLRLRLMASCDPNDKNSLPAGDIYPGTRKIQYHINFQNVGNDTAYRVVVVDTIDRRIPLESIVLGSYSHRYNLSIQGNTLVFEFPDIKLVDSATNEPGSKGFIRFSAQLEPGLQVGNTVNNRAHIYFDYNEAIITNTATVRVVDFPNSVAKAVPEASGMLLYPNPGSGVLTLVNPLSPQGFNIYNASGLLVLSGYLQEGDNRIQMTGFSPGIYILCAENGARIKFVVQ